MVGAGLDAFLVCRPCLLLNHKVNIDRFFTQITLGAWFLMFGALVMVFSVYWWRLGLEIITSHCPQISKILCYVSTIFIVYQASIPALFLFIFSPFF